MVAVRIVPPADEERLRPNFVEAFDDLENRALRSRPFARDEAIRKAEKHDVVGIESPARLPPLSPRPLSSLAAGFLDASCLRDATPCRRSRRRFEHPCPERRPQRSDRRRQGFRRPGAARSRRGRPIPNARPRSRKGRNEQPPTLRRPSCQRHRSDAFGSRSRIHPAALVKARSGPGCRR